MNRSTETRALIAAENSEPRNLDNAYESRGPRCGARREPSTWKNTDVPELWHLACHLRGTHNEHDWTLRTSIGEPTWLWDIDLKSTFGKVEVEDAAKLVILLCRQTGTWNTRLWASHFLDAELGFMLMLHWGLVYYGHADGQMFRGFYVTDQFVEAVTNKLPALTNEIRARGGQSVAGK